MCLSGSGFVVGSYVPFWQGVVCRQLCALLVGDFCRHICTFQVRGCWCADTYPSGKCLVVGSYVPLM
jgi:hypothetical protein